VKIVPHERKWVDPLFLARELRGIGFNEVEDFGPLQANDRYFKNRADGLRVGGSVRLMKARI